MSKNTKVHALETILKHEARRTYDRAKQWFKEHPDEPYCYWAQNDFMSKTQYDDVEYRKKFVHDHPEIDDITDHTLVHYDPISDIVRLDRFCPRMKQSIKELLDGKDQWTTTHDGVIVNIMPFNDNFEAKFYAEG